jgi:hypothetical protein
VLRYHTEIANVSFDLEMFGGVIENNETKLVLDKRSISMESLSLFQ